MRGWRLLTCPRVPRERRGLMVADAVVPPALPPTVLGTGGLAVPPAGAAAPAPRLGNGGVVVCHLARLEPLPSQPLEVGRGTEGLRRRWRLVHLAHPPTFFRYRGCPLHPAWGTEEARPNPLPSLPPNTGARTDILSPDYRVWSTHMCHAYRGGVRRLESCGPVS